MKEWFVDWFNTEEYLNVYRHRNDDDAKELVELILDNIRLKEHAKVLDLACGPGRHAVLFAQRENKVCAVDLSKNLLKAAKRTSRKAGLNISFIEADLRNLCIKSKFDLVVNLFTSFGYFEDDCDNYKLFEKAFNFLNKDGYFVLDYFNSRYLEKNLVVRSERNLDPGTIIQERQISGNRVIKDIKILKNGSEKHFMESVRMFTKNELVSEIERNGFTIENIFGGVRGKPFNIETSPRIIIIARK